MTRTRIEKWEHQLRRALGAVDEYLETEHGHLFPLSPNRPPHGTTANRKYDGLFDVDARFRPRRWTC